MAIDAGAAGESPLAQLRGLGCLPAGCIDGEPTIARRLRGSCLLHLGNRQRAARRASALLGVAVSRPISGYADRLAARRPARHAADPGTRLWGLGALQRRPGTRTRWLLSHAGRPERQSPLAVLPRGVQRLGPRAADAPAARPDRTLDAIDRRGRPGRSPDGASLDRGYSMGAMEDAVAFDFPAPTQPRPSAQTWFTGHIIGLPATQPRASAPGA